MEFPCLGVTCLSVLVAGRPAVEGPAVGLPGASSWPLFDTRRWTRSGVLGLILQGTSYADSRASLVFHGGRILN